MKELYRYRKMIAVYGITAFILSVFLWIGYQNGNIEKLELAYYDLSFKIKNTVFKKEQSDKGIVIIKIDNRTTAKLTEIGKSLTEIRDVYGYTVDKAYSNGAKDIGFDMIFQNFNLESPADMYFKSMVAQSKGVVFAVYPDSDKSGNMIFSTSELIDANPKNSIGHIKMNPDEDNKVRGVELFYQKESESGTKLYPSFALELYRREMKIENIEKLDEEISKKFKLFNSKLLIDYRTGTIMENSSKESFKTISMADIIDEAMGKKTIDYSIFKDKIVIIGATNSTNQDFYMTPFNKVEREKSTSVSSPGVEIHAQALNTLLNGKSITRNKSSLIVFIGVAILISILFMPFFKTGHSAVNYIVMNIAVMLISQILFSRSLFHDTLLLLFIELNLIYISSIVYKTMWERGEKRRIKEIFGKYVAKGIVEDVIKNEKKLDVGGELKEATILFSDIEGFTTISEKCSDRPAKLVEYLNNYFDRAVDAVDENGGIVDKFIGDAVMALFGLPVANDFHADMAVKTGIELKKIAEELSKEWEIEFGTKLHVRVGINTGEVIAGNIGSKNKKIEYTVIGDNVNLSSRLEGVNKYFGTSVIISSNVCERLRKPEDFIFRELDTIRVKGKDEAVTIYEVVGYREEITDLEKEKLGIFEEGIKLYKEMKFEEAEEKFKLSGENKVSTIYIERCQNFIKRRPDENWDGVYEFEEK